MKTVDNDNAGLLGSEKWDQFYSKGTGGTYPDENLLRIIKGNYADVPKSGRVLDVGFGIGGNMLMLAKAGYNVHGLEVSKTSLKAAQALADKNGTVFQLGLLTGTKINFPDNHFDILLSWNSIYYHGDRAKVQEAINDFHRVLKPGGVLLMSVIHQNSFMYRRLSDDLGDGARKIDRKDPHDNRDGLVIFFEPTTKGWRDLLSIFSDVKVGYAEMNLFNPARRDAWRLFLAKKV